MANALRSAGVEPGDRVAVQVEKTSDALLLYVACLRCGAVYIPLNNAYTGDELSFFLHDATPTLVVSDPSQEHSMVKLTDPLATTVLTLGTEGNGSLTDVSKKEKKYFATTERTVADAAAILYSSGTTGRPKGVVISHGALAANAQALRLAWRLRRDDVLLHALPIFHTHGLFVATNTVLMNGTSMIFHTRFEASDVIEDFGRATVFMGVPTYYNRLLSSPKLTAEACSAVRLFISGSAPLLKDTFGAFTERTGKTIVERYGMTEAGIITSADLKKPRRAGTVGWPLDGVSLRVADESDSALQDGETGGVQIKGTSLFTEYWNSPKKTAEEFTDDGYFRTGDVGRIDPDGQLTLVGRAKDMFISGGFNVYPKEIEQVLDTLEGVEESAVVGLPHPDFGEAGIAIVVPVPNQTLNFESLRTDLKNQLANYKVPKLIIEVDVLPRNAMGKVQKSELQNIYRDLWDESLPRRNS